MGCIWYCQEQFGAGTGCARSMSAWFRFPLLGYQHHGESFSIDRDWRWLATAHKDALCALLRSQGRHEHVSTYKQTHSRHEKYKHNLMNMHTCISHDTRGHIRVDVLSHSITPPASRSLGETGGEKEHGVRCPNISQHYSGCCALWRSRRFMK